VTLRTAVIIPSIGRVAELDRCVEALKTLAVQPDEVIVVLQGNDGAALGRSVQARNPSATVVVTEHVGAAIARNAGAASSTADLILFIDDDCLGQPGLVDAYLSEFLANPDLGLASGKVLSEPDPAVDELPLGLQVRAVPVTFMKRRNPVGTADRAGNMAVRATVFRALGGFDTSLGAGSEFRAAEDTDLVYRAMKAGVQIRYLPAAAVHHVQWRSLQERLRAERGYAFGLGAFIAGHARKGDLYALTLAPRLTWHMGVKPLVGGIARRKSARALSGLAYLIGIPWGMIRGVRRVPDLHRFDAVKAVEGAGSGSD
jgi:GT2 family glycosyltransferase